MKDWKPSPDDPNSGIGHYGTCCAEMDIWGNQLRSRHIRAQFRGRLNVRELSVEITPITGMMGFVIKMGVISTLIGWG